jgi:hypothetical protein
MKNIFLTLLIILLAAPQTACSPTPAPDATTAEQTLIEFFDLLNKGQYAEADKLYTGSYDELISMNPDITPSDHAALWKRGCEQNGLQCLTARHIVLDISRTASYYFFRVEFNAPDGSLFVRGPCCGATETEMPSQSSFTYTIIVVNGRCKVATMPVYVP